MQIINSFIKNKFLTILIGTLAFIIIILPISTFIINLIFEFGKYAGTFIRLLIEGKLCI